MESEVNRTARRNLMASGLVLLTRGALGSANTRLPSTPHENAGVEYGKTTLPNGIRSRRIDTNNHVVLHVLEAGYESPGRPVVVLLHGFPELAYTWRKQMLPLAGAGFHVVAPDARGCGLSASQPVAYSDNLVPYSMLNRVSDVLGVVRALGQAKVAMIVGHDWGGLTAQWCARLRPDVFQSVVSISTPFLSAPAGAGADVDIDKALAALPVPRKHYFSYSASREANENMWRAPQGVHDLLRELYYVKSADWKDNKPFPLKSWTASELAKLPTYYVMDLHKGMAETLAEHPPSPTEIAACKWLTEADLQVYAAQYIRTGFQGGLNYYRVDYEESLWSELDSFAGRTIDVPACYIGGSNEWAVYQSPGAFQAMHTVCTQLRGVHLVPARGIRSSKKGRRRSINGWSTSSRAPQ